MKNKLLKIKGVKSTVTSIVLGAPKGPRNGAHSEASKSLTITRSLHSSRLISSIQTVMRISEEPNGAESD